MNNFIEHERNDHNRGEPKYVEKVCLSATFCIINPIWAGLVLELIIHDDKLPREDKKKGFLQ